MEKFPSKDGTLLAYQRSGSGSPLVLVHGTGASAARWQPVLAGLEEHHTVYALNRRGRAGSGDTQPYAIQREFEDVASIVHSIGHPANLLGHSFGGICALEATLLTSRVQNLILYEPPIPINGLTDYPEGLLDQLDALLAAGDREGILTTFALQVLRMSPEEFERYRAAPIWNARLASAHTLPRELRAQASYRFNPERFRRFTIPTLLLVGELSQPRFKSASELLSAALPKSQTIILTGQKHNAMDTAPDLFTQVVTNFLQESIRDN